MRKENMYMMQSVLTEIEKRDRFLTDVTVPAQTICGVVLNQFVG